MKNSLVTLLATILLFGSCKKESPNNYCWQHLDVSGNSINIVCNKTEAEMQALYSNSCSYYKVGYNYCWMIGSHIFIADKPEDFITRYLQCYGNTSAVKVACDYCQQWYSRQKYAFKSNSTFTYSPVKVEQLCGDTVHTLFKGREIILRETADSLITLQFSNDGSF